MTKIHITDSAGQRFPVLVLHEAFLLLNEAKLIAAGQAVITTVSYGHLSRKAVDVKSRTGRRVNFESLKEVVA